jgi:hypothetical protein
MTAMQRLDRFYHPVELPSGLDSLSSPDPVSAAPLPQSIVFTAGVFSGLVPRGDRYSPIWPMNRPDKLWSLSDLFVFVNELRPDHCYLPSQWHSWPTPNAGGFRLQCSLHKTDPLGYPAILSLKHVNRS